MNLILINLLSTWHLYCAESYLMANNIGFSDEKIVICIFKHSASNQFRITTDDFRYLSNPKFHVSTNNLENMNELEAIVTRELSNNSIEKLTIITSGGVNLRMLLLTRKVTVRNFVVYDEGIGTYYSRKLWNLEERVLGRHANKGYLVLKDILKNITEFLLNNRVTRWEILQRNNHYEPNECFTKTLKDYYETYHEKRRLSSPIKDGDAIYISDNIGLIIENKEHIIKYYKNLYAIMRELVPNENTLWFKPHPNEMKNQEFMPLLASIGFMILTEPISSEELAYSYDLLFFGLCSTSLLTSALIFLRKTYSFIDLLDDEEVNEYGHLKKIEYKRIINRVTEIDLVEDN